MHDRSNRVAISLRVFTDPIFLAMTMLGSLLCDGSDTSYDLYSLMPISTSVPKGGVVLLILHY